MHRTGERERGEEECEQASERFPSAAPRREEKSERRSMRVCVCVVYAYEWGSVG